MKIFNLTIIISTIVLFYCCSSEKNTTNFTDCNGFFKDSIIRELEFNKNLGSYLTFPIHYFDTNSTSLLHINKTSSSYYSSHLYRSFEKPVTCFEESDIFLRMLVIQPFAESIIVKIERSENDQIYFTKKTLSNANSELPNRCVFESIIIDTLDILKICAMFNENNFYKMKVQEDFDLGHDGSIFFIEIFNEGKYHYVERWQPNIIQPSRDSNELHSFVNISNYFISLCEIYTNETTISALTF